METYFLLLFRIHRPLALLSLSSRSIPVCLTLPFNFYRPEGLGLKEKNVFNCIDRQISARLHVNSSNMTKADFQDPFRSDISLYTLFSD